MPHSHRWNRYGHALGSPISPIELATHRKAIRRFVDRYWASKGLQAALRVADDLLHFQPGLSLSWQLSVADRMAVLRAAKVTREAVLLCVLEVAALDHWSNRFRTSRELQYAFAREVLKLVPTHGFKLTATVCRMFGDRINEGLGAFALVALARIEQDRLQEDEDRESLLRGFDAEDPNAPPHPAQALAQPRDKHKAPRVQP